MLPPALAIMIQALKMDSTLDSLHSLRRRGGGVHCCLQAAGLGRWTLRDTDCAHLTHFGLMSMSTCVHQSPVTAALAVYIATT